VLHGPLRKVHDVRGFVNADDAVGGGGGQQESQVLGRELHIRDAGPRIHQGGAAHPSPGWGIAGGDLIANHLLPNGGGAIERAGGHHLAELRMRPGHAPNGAGVGLPAAGDAPLALPVLIPDL